MKDFYKYKVQVDIIINLIEMHLNKDKTSLIIFINVLYHIKNLNLQKLNIKLFQDGLYFKEKKIKLSLKIIKKMYCFKEN